MANSKSMSDVAFDILSGKKRAVAFPKLWAEVAKKTGAPNDRVASFYSDLSLDGRFVALEDNKWDIKAHRKFSETQVDMSGIEVDDDSDGVVYDDDGNIIEEPEEE